MAQRIAAPVAIRSDAREGTMDAQNFDAIVKDFSTAGSRRRMLRILGAAAFGVIPLTSSVSLVSARPDPKNCPDLATGPKCGKDSRCVDGWCFHSAQECLINALVAGAKGNFKDALKAIGNKRCGDAALKYLLRFVEQECKSRNPLLTCDTCRTFKSKGGVC